MEQALRRKFAPGASWHEKLMEEKSKIVEYNNWGDSFWGVDVYSEFGENHLSKLLMKIREEFKATLEHSNSRISNWKEEFWATSEQALC